MTRLWLIIGGFLAILLAAALVVVMKKWVSRFTDRRIAKYQSDLITEHYEEVQNIYQTMRGWRHDYHNHIQAMKAHLAMGQLEELQAYLDMLDNDLQMVDTVIKTGNIRLDAILNSKLSLMASKKIHVHAKAQVPKILTVNELDLCVMIGNLLNNAMESCEKVADEQERFIRIYIGVLKQQLYISVTNSVGDEVRKLGLGKYLTTKGSGHGFGLGRIAALVEKYGGFLNLQNEPGVFAAEILLPL